MDLSYPVLLIFSDSETSQRSVNDVLLGNVSVTPTLEGSAIPFMCKWFHITTEGLAIPTGQENMPLVKGLRKIYCPLACL